MWGLCWYTARIFTLIILALQVWDSDVEHGDLSPMMHGIKSPNDDLWITVREHRRAMANGKFLELRYNYSQMDSYSSKHL